MSEIKTTINEQLLQLQMFMHRAMFRDFAGGAKAHNPHRGQGRVLAMLKIKPEISQKELHFLLGMSKQSLAELLAKLEKSGFIVREQSEDDKRVVTIKLTEEGMKAADDVDFRSSRAQGVFEDLTEEELASLSDYLGRIIKRYEEQFPHEDFQQRREMMKKFIEQKGFGGGPGCGGGGPGHGGRGHGGPGHGGHGQGGPGHGYRYRPEGQGPGGHGRRVRYSGVDCDFPESHSKKSEHNCAREARRSNYYAYGWFGRSGS